MTAERMAVTRKSMFTNRIHTAWLPVTQSQLNRYELEKENAHRVFPDIPPEWREFIMTGVTPAEWKKEFGRTRSADYAGPEIEPVRIEYRGGGD